MAWSILGVHAGISKKFDIVKGEAYDILVKGSGAYSDIVLLGHSQGAALGLLMHLFLKRKGFNNVKSYLCGCPKILNLWRFFTERKYGKDVTQFIVRTDIVPRLSPICFQIGTNVFLGKKKPVWKWKISDHYPKVYRELLED
jgi:hypothetical protein